MDCLFCKIAKKELQTSSVYEDGFALAFLDVSPRAPGHTLVIPKEHAENILDLSDSAVGPLFLAVKKVTAGIKKALNPDGFTIGINHGKYAGQVVEHLHIHIIPRFKNDLGGSIQSVVHNIPDKLDMKEIEEKIRETLSSAPRLR